MIEGQKYSKYDVFWEDPQGREGKVGRQRLSVICGGPSAVVERSTEVWVPSASSEVPGLAASVFLEDY